MNNELETGTPIEIKTAWDILNVSDRVKLKSLGISDIEHESFVKLCLLVEDAFQAFLRTERPTNELELQKLRESLLYWERLDRLKERVSKRLNYYHNHVRIAGTRRDWTLTPAAYNRGIELRHHDKLQSKGSR